MVYSNTATCGGNDYGKSGCSPILFSLKYWLMHLNCNFFLGLHFYTLSKTLMACRDMQLRFSKLNQLVNNAFAAWQSCIITLLLFVTFSFYIQWQSWNNDSPFLLNKLPNYFIAEAPSNSLLNLPFKQKHCLYVWFSSSPPPPFHSQWKHSSTEFSIWLLYTLPGHY